MEKISSVPGSKDVIEWFGEWPSFHDAEILELHLSRSGRSWIKIHYWNTLKKVDASGAFAQDKHATVTFTMETVTDLNLADFSGQNVIFGLSLDQEEGGFKLTLAPCYGLAGNLHAKTISVSVTPGKPIQS